MTDIKAEGASTDTPDGNRPAVDVLALTDQESWDELTVSSTCRAAGCPSIRRHERHERNERNERNDRLGQSRNAEHTDAGQARARARIEMNRPIADHARVAQQSAIESSHTAARGATRSETRLRAAELRQVPVSLSAPGDRSTPETEAIVLLTARELDVLRCLIEGLTRNEIGPLLHISPNTVRTHIHSILGKLDVHSAPSSSVRSQG